MTPEEKEQLLKEAEERYPPGTIYNIAHLNQHENHRATRGDYPLFWLDGHDGYIVESLGNRQKNKHNLSEVVWSYGKWAKIISKPEEQNSQFKFFL